MAKRLVDEYSQYWWDLALNRDCLRDLGEAIAQQ